MTAMGKFCGTKTSNPMRRPRASNPSKVNTFLRIVFIGSVFLLCVAAFAQTKLSAGQTGLVLNIDGKGQVVILLHTKEAPKTTEQIIKLAQSGFYNGQKFFKVVKKPRPFIVQVGDPASKTKALDDPGMGQGGSGTKVPYEDSGFPNEEGAVGLSTLPNDRDSGDSQFYMLLGPARFLDGSYTVFGKVISGMDIVRTIELGDKVSSASVVRG